MSTTSAPRKVVLRRKHWSTPKSTAKALHISAREQRTAQKAVEEFLMTYKRPLVLRNGKLFLGGKERALLKKLSLRSRSRRLSRA
jgi:hypothetical protein